jgi:hypothetical protein
MNEYTLNLEISLVDERSMLIWARLLGDAPQRQKGQTYGSLDRGTG